MRYTLSGTSDTVTDNLDAIALDRTARDLVWMRGWAEHGATFILKHKELLPVTVSVFSIAQFDGQVVPLLDKGWRVTGVSR